MKGRKISIREFKTLLKRVGESMRIIITLEEVKLIIGHFSVIPLKIPREQTVCQHSRDTKYL